MANQNVLQLTQQSGSANTTSVLYAVTGGTTDTGLPLTVLFNSPALTGTPTVAGYAALASANTYTANQTIGFSGSPTLILNDTAGTNFAAVEWAKAGQIQWWLNADFTGGVWCMNRYVGGSFQDKPISIANSTGVVTILSLTTSTATVLNGAVSGTGMTNYMASPPAIGGTAAAAGKFTTLQATSTITPSTTSGIVGTTLADNANAGSVGEYVTASATAVALTSPATSNITSISLTAGDWDVSGVVEFNAGSGASLTTAVAAVTTTSASSGGLGSRARLQVSTGVTAGATPYLPTPVVRVNVSTTTTVYLTGTATFAGGTLSADGLIRARRVR